MTAPATYASRFARFPTLFELLAAHPDGLGLGVVSECLGVPVSDLRDELRHYYTLDLGAAYPPFQPQVGIELLGADGDVADVADAEVVRLSVADGAAELGVELLAFDDLACVYTAGRTLLELEPDDRLLAEAMDVVVATMMGESDGSGEPGESARYGAGLDELTAGCRQRRRVRIVYSRAWQPGVTTRVIEPYRLVVGARDGWEVDAGPVDDLGRIRTYLLSNVREAKLLSETFDHPEDLDDLLAAQRTTTAVRVRLPHAVRWLGDHYAEQVTVMREHDDCVELELQLLPPVQHRLGLLLLEAGPTAEIITPAELADSGRLVARRLLEHHQPEA